jgi:hypothetical protein
MHVNTTARRIATAALVCGAAAFAAPAGASAAFGDAQILAPFPANPGFPEGVAVRDGKVYAGGAATFGTTAAGPSAVVAFDRSTGAQVARHDTKGENLLAEHGGSSIAFDGEGRLYFLNTQLGTLRLNPQTSVQESYSPPFPDLNPCLPPIVNPPCSPNPLPLPPLPNDIAFAQDGSAYVTDSMQATIWRIPKGGGAPQIWFQDSRFNSPYIGVNGLRISPDGTRVFVTVSVDVLGRASVYSLPTGPAKPTAAQMKLEYRFAAGELPDGIAFGESGDLYVSMASPTAPGVMVLRPDSTVKARIKNPGLNLTSPFDGPANIAFDGAGRILMTNHAPVTGLVTKQFSIVDVEVGDNGWPLITPQIG